MKKTSYERKNGFAKKNIFYAQTLKEELEKMRGKFETGFLTRILPVKCSSYCLVKKAIIGDNFMVFYQTV